MADVKRLIQNWSLPDRSEDRAQITLRLPYPDWARLQALKEVYPKRAVNDLLCDIINASLDDIVQALPSYVISEEEARHMANSQEEYDELVGSRSGPGATFDFAYRRILESKSSEDSDKVSA